MFEGLSDRLERSFKILKGQGHITEINVAETLKEVRKALLDADVSYKIPSVSIFERSSSLQMMLRKRLLVPMC